jgi:hypothetical protein
MAASDSTSADGDILRASSLREAGREKGALVVISRRYGALKYRFGMSKILFSIASYRIAWPSARASVLFVILCEFASDFGCVVAFLLMRVRI